MPKYLKLTLSCIKRKYFPIHAHCHWNYCHILPAGLTKEWSSSGCFLVELKNRWQTGHNILPVIFASVIQTGPFSLNLITMPSGCEYSLVCRRGLCRVSRLKRLYNPPPQRRRRIAWYGQALSKARKSVILLTNSWRAIAPSITPGCCRIKTAQFPSSYMFHALPKQRLVRWKRYLLGATVWALECISIFIWAPCLGLLSLKFWSNCWLSLSKHSFMPRQPHYGTSVYLRAW